MTVKTLIKFLQGTDNNLEVVCTYGNEYTAPQISYGNVYRHRDPSYIVPSYTDKQTNRTDEFSIPVLVLGMR
jgi:hypothetical protein